jgi:hypothetical protein
MWKVIKESIEALFIAALVTTGIFCYIHPEDAKYIGAAIALLCAASAHVIAYTWRNEMRWNVVNQEINEFTYELEKQTNDNFWEEDKEASALPGTADSALGRSDRDNSSTSVDSREWVNTGTPRGDARKKR